LAYFDKPVASAAPYTLRLTPRPPHPKEHPMNTDQAKGRIKSAQGKAKEFTGKAVVDKTQERKGKLERAGGKGQGLYGDVKANIRKSSGTTNR
jgi:uncharacterized protein YjbJ (UPF0337 family)